MTDEISVREKLKVQQPTEVVRWLNMLVYGEPGAGKTWLAGTAQDSPLTAPMLLLDVEGGVLTLRHRPDIDVIRVRTTRDIENVYNTLFLAKEKKYYKTVVIDSLTELQDLDMRIVQKDEYDRLGAEKVDMDVPSQRAWGKSGNRLKILIRAFKDLETNFIATCLEGYTIDENSGVVSYFPSLPGKLRGQVPGYFDIVGRLRTDRKGGTTGEIIRTLQVAKTPKVVGKDRSGALGELIIDPTIPMIMDRIQTTQVTEEEKIADGHAA